MRKMMTALALSSLFAAAPAFAAHKHVAKPAKTAPVAEGAVKAEGEPAKTDEKAPPKKSTKKHPKKTEKTETPPAEAPAK